VKPAVWRIRSEGSNMKAALYNAFAVLLVGLNLSGCSRLDQNWEAKKLVQRQLKDPNSARFTEVVRGTEATCGYVNSKNGFGAYEGRLAFVVAGDDLSFDDMGMTFRTLVRKKCDDKFAFPFSMEKSDQAIKDINAGIESLRASGIMK
jgi:hypothetical protein